MEKYVLSDTGLVNKIESDWTWANSLKEAVDYFVDLHYTSPINKNTIIKVSKDTTVILPSVFDGEEWHKLRPVTVALATDNLGYKEMV
jgi:hypothetical protein|nr:MAG TPA: hypothetical protein [Caudoviricetes sp.]